MFLANERLQFLQWDALHRMVIDCLGIGRGRDGFIAEKAVSSFCLQLQNLTRFSVLFLAAPMFPQTFIVSKFPTATARPLYLVVVDPRNSFWRSTT